MRLLLVAPLFPPLHTGAGRQAESVFRRLAPEVETTVLTLGGPGLPEHESRDGLQVRRVGSVEDPGPARRFGRAATTRLVRDAAPDAMVVLGVGPVTYAAVAVARFRRIPIAVKLTLEGEDDPATLAEKRGGTLRLAVLRRASAVVCPSGRMLELARAENVAENRLALIPNGVDVERFSPNRARVGTLEGSGRPEGGADRPGPRLVTVGAVERRKRVDLLLDVVGRLLPDHPALTLTVVGGPGRTSEDAAYAAELRKRAGHAPLAGHVTFTGSRPDPETALREASIFVLASEAEGLPNALLEAMAAGLAPVTRDLPAIREVLDSGTGPACGELVASDDPAAWAGALDPLLRDPERTRALGERARRTVLDRFDLESAAASWRDLLTRITGGGR